MYCLLILLEKGQYECYTKGNEMSDVTTFHAITEHKKITPCNDFAVNARGFLYLQVQQKAIISFMTKYVL